MCKERPPVRTLTELFLIAAHNNKKNQCACLLANVIMNTQEDFKNMVHSYNEKVLTIKMNKLPIQQPG